MHIVETLPGNCIKHANMATTFRLRCETNQHRPRAGDRPFSNPPKHLAVMLAMTGVMLAMTGLHRAWKVIHIDWDTAPCDVNVNCEG